MYFFVHVATCSIYNRLDYTLSFQTNIFRFVVAQYCLMIGSLRQHIAVIKFLDYVWLRVVLCCKLMKELSNNVWFLKRVYLFTRITEKKDQMTISACLRFLIVSHYNLLNHNIIFYISLLSIFLYYI